MSTIQVQTQNNSRYQIMGCPDGYTPVLFTQNSVPIQMSMQMPMQMYQPPQMVTHQSLPNQSQMGVTGLSNPFVMMPSPSPIPMMMPQSVNPCYSLSPVDLGMLPMMAPMQGMTHDALPNLDFNSPSDQPLPLGDLKLEDNGTINIGENDSLAFNDSFKPSNSRGRSRSRSMASRHSRSSSSRSPSRISRSGSQGSRGSHGRSGSCCSRDRVFNYSRKEDLRVPVKNQKKVAQPVLKSEMTKKELVNETLDYLYAVFGENFDQEGNRGPTVLRVKVKTRGSLEHICSFIEQCVEQGLLSRISCPISTKKARLHIRGYLAYLETIDMKACEKVIDLYNEYNKANLLEDGSEPFRGISTNPVKPTTVNKKHF